MDEIKISPVDRLANLVDKVAPKKIPVCMGCEFWKVDKTDELQRRHAAQGRALCAIDGNPYKPFLHHSNLACERFSAINLGDELKRVEYLKGR